MASKRTGTVGSNTKELMEAIEYHTLNPDQEACQCGWKLETPKEWTRHLAQVLQETSKFSVIRELNRLEWRLNRTIEMLLTAQAPRERASLEAQAQGVGRALDYVQEASRRLV